MSRGQVALLLIALAALATKPRGEPDRTTCRGMSAACVHLHG